MDENYINFFEKIKLFKEKQKKQKQRGLNDYNMVNIVRKENAEVGMHSNVIYSLIDPNGLHYQDDLFLQIFIKDVLEINDFGDIISVKVEESTNENRRVDFTIKSGNYYIGIEMKIDASDLENQISHYYEDLEEKASKDSNQKVLIYYLTKDGKEASFYSHREIEYKKISFEKHILQWIENCQKEVKNITNLNEAFENYKDIVKKITNKYEGRVMSLKDEIAKNEDYYAITLEIEKEMPKIREEIMTKFFNDAQLKLQTILGNSWEVSIEGKLNTRWGSPLRLIKKSWKDNSKYLFIAFEFDEHNYKRPSFGIVRKDVDGINLKSIREKFSSELSDIDLVQEKQSTWWLYYQSNDADLFKKVFFKEYSDDDLVKDLLYYYEHFEKKQSLLSNINKNIIGLE